MLKEKNVAVLGAGASGIAAAKLAYAKGANVRLFDSGSISESLDLPKGIIAISNATEAIAAETQCDLLVISPGIDTYGSFVAAFAKGAGELIGEVELACRFYQGKIIAITGTNGKTTTTEIVQKILNHAGISCAACGNFGVPVSEIILWEEQPKTLALEISSFQLETITQFCPDISIWLNFDADHMDRYPSLEAYKTAKLRIFKNQTPEQTAIIREGEQVGAIQARKISFTSENTKADYTVKDLIIYKKQQEVLNLANTKMRGLHNAENVMAAMAAAELLGVSPHTVTEALQGFAPPLHRCELVRTLDGVEYLNDSKATNLHALDSALRSQSRPLVLIAGGKNKGLNYTELRARIKEKVHTAIVFGEIADQLLKEFPSATALHKANSLEEAVQLAQQLSQHGDAVLFSPGTSSFDMFKGYAHRGDVFRHAVNDLK